VSMSVLADYPHQHTHDSNRSLLWTGLGSSRARLAPHYKSSNYLPGAWSVVDGPPVRRAIAFPPQACGRFQSTSSTTKAEHVSKYRYDPKTPRNIRESREIAQEVVLPGKDLQFVVRPPVAVRFGNFYWQRRIGLPSRVSCLLWR
jgi:hypothetical protein